MNLRTEHFARRLQTLEKSLEQLQRAPVESIDYEIYRNAVVKGFELTLETTGKMLRKGIKTYTGNPRAVDELSFKEVLRHAGKHGLLDPAAVDRWFAYRDNRNSTAHDYGKGFAEETLVLMSDFLSDVRLLEATMREKFGHAET
jgi:nucleotidyltransferase substrate binding protein (TIGR01987 family)